MNLRRGFKTEANTTSRELRAELGLDAAAPVCPFRLCEHLEVGVFPLSAFRVDQAEAVAYFLGQGSGAFFAMTLCDGTSRAVIYNDAQSAARTAADIAHEIAHMLLLHPPHRLLDSTGRRHFDRELEDEANWLGPAILVSDEAAVLVARRGWPLSVAAAHYGVSEHLMRMRLNTTGAYRRVDRAA